MLKKLLTLLTPPERKRAVVLMGMILVMALLDMLGVSILFSWRYSQARASANQRCANTAFITSRHIGIQTLNSSCSPSVCWFCCW